MYFRGVLSQMVRSSYFTWDLALSLELIYYSVLFDCFGMMFSGLSSVAWNSTLQDALFSHYEINISQLLCYLNIFFYLERCSPDEKLKVESQN